MTVLYAEHVQELKTQTVPSVVSSCIPALSHVTINRLLGALVDGRDDKSTETNQTNERSVGSWERGGKVHMFIRRAPAAIFALIFETFI